MIDFPKSVKVANHIIKIIEWTDKEANAQNQFGEFSGNELIIRINTELHQSLIIETLWHEILHAIYWSYNIKDDDKEERTITVFATGISQVMSDNPKVNLFLNTGKQNDNN